MPFSDSEAIQAVFGEFNAAWTSKNAARCAELFHEQGDVIALDGTVCHGRAEIAAYYDRQLNGPYKDLQVRDMQFEPIRFLASNVAVMNAEWNVVGFRKGDGSEREPTRARITFVMTKGPSGWCYAAARFMVPFETGLR